MRRWCQRDRRNDSQDIPGDRSVRPHLTIQGEGYLAGLPTHFVRFGLCDFRCSWCDSMFAVEPEVVSRTAERLDAVDIVTRVRSRGSSEAVPWVTLSGGNPAIHELQETVNLLQGYGYLVSVETQGSIWRDWLNLVDHLTVSPKPPSSGMATAPHATQLDTFVRRAALALRSEERSFKIVVFDDADLDWARWMFASYAPSWQRYLSVGTDPVGQWGTDVVAAESQPFAVRKIAERYGWLCDQVAGDSAFANVRVLPQLHVIAYGHKRGV